LSGPACTGGVRGPGMKPVVFLGPSLRHEDARTVLDAQYLPPAAQGDIYRAALAGPPLICLIDGTFNRTPAVWHKEILWAISKGIWVVGGASMGALRAVELAPFGMIGVGQVFQWFFDGTLEDDDEVAVAHAPEEQQFRPLSEAMVNIRSTVAAATAASVLDEQSGEALLAAAKRLHYTERNLETAIGECLSSKACPPSQMQRFRRWLTRGQVNQKQLDAVAVLMVAGQLAGMPAQAASGWQLHRTDAWEAARLRALRAVPLGDVSAGRAAQPALLEELRLSGEYPAVAAGALGWAAAQEASDSAVPDLATINEAAHRLRQDLMLNQPQAFDAWLAAQGLHADDSVDQFFAKESCYRRHLVAFEPAILRQLPDYLRHLGRYGELNARAEVKRRLLKASYQLDPDLGDARISTSELWRWYFVGVLGDVVPDDIEAYALRNGFEGTVDLTKAVLREYLFQQLQRASDRRRPDRPLEQTSD
jgi:hypothetical protein